MKKYKKVYIEITNICNLACPFCAHSKRTKEYISISNFKIILDKLTEYTDYLYFHILGEPLLHPNINELITLASQNFKINITTNGYFIRNIESNKNIRQLNISLHSFNDSYNLSLENYLNEIFSVADTLKHNTYINFRLWVRSSYTTAILKKICQKYNVDIDENDLKNNTSLDKNIFISTHDEFIWPTQSNLQNQTGKCYALKDHIGILVDGSIVPCCLDSEGSICFGNIYKDDLKDIIESKRYKTMLKNFQENKRVEMLCKRCNFK